MSLAAGAFYVRRQALQHAPGFELAQGNLNDLARPVAGRHAPWPYTFQYWVSHSQLAQLVERVLSLKNQAGPPVLAGRQAIDEDMARWLSRNLQPGQLERLRRLIKNSGAKWVGYQGVGHWRMRHTNTFRTTAVRVVPQSKGSFPRK